LPAKSLGGFNDLLNILWRINTTVILNKMAQIVTSVKDGVIKDVIMHGFAADESTCCEAELRFLIQQKTALQDQWRLSKRDLLKYLRKNIDTIDRQDIEKIVQEPDLDFDMLEEEDEDTTSNSDSNNKDAISSKSTHTNLTSNDCPDYDTVDTKGEKNDLSDHAPNKKDSSNKGIFYKMSKLIGGNNNSPVHSSPENSNADKPLNERLESVLLRMQQLEEHHNAEMASMKNELAEIKKFMPITDAPIEELNQEQT